MSLCTYFPLFYTYYLYRERKVGMKMAFTEIEKVTGREILDSRGNPTVEAEVTLIDGTKATGQAPSGASCGKYEALELRDGDKKRYHGKGVLKAVDSINQVIANAIIGLDAADSYAVDRAMREADGTEEKKKLGANAILAVSLACAKAAAKSISIPLYQLLGGIQGNKLPVPMMNILNGGAHASNRLDIQEFMIMPVGACCFSEGLRQCAEVYHCLKEILSENGLSTGVGDEGGFAPDVSEHEEAILLIMAAIEKAGYKPGKDFCIALDAAASEWKGKKKGEYTLPKSKRSYTTEDLIAYWEKLIGQFPILSMEDPLDEEDWEGWKKMTEKLGDKVQLVGDDLFVTNLSRLEKGITEKCANAILIKLNQIGTLSETIDTIQKAQSAGYAVIVSHRSGETEDTFIADLSVGVNSGQIKTGAPCRSERVAKYNRLLRIEEELGKNRRE